jgi:cysteine desulfurase
MSAPAPTNARPGRIYFDWNATNPPSPRVLAVMAEVGASVWGNASSVHAQGRAARAILDEARELLARGLGASPRDVILTGSATEANNLALQGARGLVTSRLEHPSVVRVAEHLEAQGTTVRWLPVPPSGRLEPDALEGMLSDLPAGFTVAAMAANHETGVVQPIAELAQRTHAHGGYLHVDAAQAFGKWPARDWSGADSLVLAAHKIRGPRGVGALIWRHPAPPTPVLLGGAQERGLRPGTPEPMLVAGFAEAVRELGAIGEAQPRLRRLRDHLEHSVAGLMVPNVEGEPRLPHVASLRAPGWRGDELVAALDLAGVSVSSGSACSAGTAEPPAAVRAMLGPEAAGETIRVSMGADTTDEEVDRLIGLLQCILGAAGDQP